MTLIAAFQPSDRATLVGDLLITKGNQSTSVQKKILKLSDNVAIGWTGHLLVANEIIPTLRKKISSKHTTIDEVEGIFTQELETSFGNNLQINIIGWVITSDKKYCFRWNSAYPQELFFDTAMFDGSGEAVANALIGKDGIRDVLPEDGLSTQEWIISSLLNKCGRLMNTEIFEQPLAKTFGSGFAYEIIVENDQGNFEYVDNILYSGLMSTIDTSGKHLASAPTNKVYKYESIGNITKISEFDQSTGSIHINFILAPGEDESVFDFTHHSQWTGFKSNFYCIGIQIKSAGHNTRYSIFVDVSKEGESIIIAEASLFTIKINAPINLIEQIHQLYCVTENPSSHPAII